MRYFGLPVYTIITGWNDVKKKWIKAYRSNASGNALSKVAMLETIFTRQCYRSYKIAIKEMCQDIILGNNMSCSVLNAIIKFYNASSDVANFPKLACSNGMFSHPQAPDRPHHAVIFK